MALKRFWLVPAVLVCVALGGCGQTTVVVTQPHPHQSSPHVTQPSPAGTQFRFFSPQSFWNQPLPANAPVDPNSSAMVGALDAEVQSEVHDGSGPWINTEHDGVPIVTVPASQPTVRVILNRGDPSEDSTLRAAWSAVPLPANATPSSGDDDLAVWQPSTDRMWEFFDMTRQNGQWTASWGGAMQNVSQNLGVYGPNAWSGAEPYWGVSAASFPLVGGAILVQQVRNGDINHALALGIPAPRAGVFALPAQRTDGRSTSPDALPEGARLRLDPTLNLNALHLPPLTLMIAEAAQRYGIFIRDTSGIISFYAEDADSTTSASGSDPFYGPDGFYGGKEPSALLADFPWSHLQVMKLDLRSSSE